MYRMSALDPRGPMFGPAGVTRIDRGFIWSGR